MKHEFLIGDIYFSCSQLLLSDKDYIILSYLETTEKTI